MTVKLRLIDDYVNPPHGYVLKKGEQIEVDEQTARWLQADSPGSFEIVVPRAKAVRAPAKNKQIEEPAESK